MTRSSDDDADYEGLPDHDPIHPGKAFQLIFEGNMHLDLREVSRNCDIDMSNIEAIISGEATIDREIARRIFRIYGGVAELLLRLQFTYDYFKKHHKRPPESEVYNIYV